MKISPDAFIARRAVLAAACAAATLNQPLPAFAKYGEFAKIGSDTSFTVGDSANECMYATPGTGVCQVYKSSDPKIWSTPDTGKALKKLIAAADGLAEIDGFIAASKWTAISQSLGASRDLREAVGFLTAAAADKQAEKCAKKVFSALDGVSLAATKKDKATAALYYSKYAEAMPELIGLFV